MNILGDGIESNEGSGEFDPASISGVTVMVQKKVRWMKPVHGGVEGVVVGEKYVVVIWGKDNKHKGAIEEQVCGLWVYFNFKWSAVILKIVKSAGSERVKGAGALAWKKTRERVCVCGNNHQMIFFFHTGKTWQMTLEREKGGREGGEECLIKGTWLVLKQPGSCSFA